MFCRAPTQIMNTSTNLYDLSSPTRSTSRFGGPEAYQICVTLLKKSNPNHKFKIRYKSQYLLRENKSQKSQIWKADKYQRHHKIQKNSTIFSLSSCLTYSLITSAYDNFIVFSVERVGRSFFFPLSLLVEICFILLIV